MKNSFKFYTYVHTRNDTGEVFYVGKGKGTRAFDKGRNYHWSNVVAKHGYTIHIVAYFADETEALAHEKELIAELRDAGLKLTNMTDGGDGVSGMRHTKESRARIGAASAGNQYARGNVLSAETRAKIGAGSRGKVVSAETRAKLSAAAKAQTPETRAKQGAKMLGNKNAQGVVRSAETRAKMSASAKGKIISPEQRLKISSSLKERNMRKLDEETI